MMKQAIVNLAKRSYMQLISKQRPQINDTIAYLLSFPENNRQLLTELIAEFPQLRIYYTKNCQAEALDYARLGAMIQPLEPFAKLLKNIPVIAGARLLLADNYFAFLGALDLAQTPVIQLWHANGAIKSFGLEAKYAQQATPADRLRYQEVYQRFSHYVVASETMGRAFQRSYLAKPAQIKLLGTPRTDRYFDESWRRDVKQRVRDVFGDQPIALYAPTYRETATSMPDTAWLQTKDYRMLVKAHPHDHDLRRQVPEQMLDLAGFSLMELLPSVDLLISDYSSVPFEYALANPTGKMLFYSYDLEEYQAKVGIQPDFEKWAPGPIFKELTTKELLVPQQDFHQFNAMWNTMNDGQAIPRVIQEIKELYHGD